MRTAQPPHPNFPDAEWQKSSYSSGSDASDKHVCVEVAAVGDAGHAIRDSTDPQGAVLRLDPGALKNLIARLK
ncbi:DUF397 domain-containing protein [Actinomadura sp. NPDC048955]|uniref:DUF397 domain-containing protein n=1 Tax=Actinomadura sp. NPDC048955 TaxID=3158228 RepID=UPI0033F4E628